VNGNFTRRNFLAAASTAAPASAARTRTALIAHWKLAGDARDSSSHGLHGRNHGADLAAAGPRGKARTAAKFNGRDSFIEVPDGPPLRLGARDFSIAVWVNTGKELDDVAGDILSKYDPVSRRGFNFNIKTNSVTTSQSNHRHVQFGIDNGRLGSWADCGRPGNCVYVMGLAVYDGRLFAGTCEAGKDEAGHVYRYAGGGDWIDCGRPDGSNSISALAVYEGKLYAGSARYNLAGSALSASPNEQPGGKIYRYEGDGRWTDCGKIGGCPAVASLAVYRGQLYASSLYAPAGTFRYEGGQTWAPCGTPEGRRVEALAVYNGSLFGTGYDKGEVYRYEGDRWRIVGVLPDTTQTYGFAVYRGELYVSTWPGATVFRYQGDNNWVACGRPGNELESMGMAVHNGKLYAGTLPLAQVYRYESGSTWTLTGQLDKTPNVRYRRAWSMAVFQGKLFCGTLPSGHVYSLEAGNSVTHDYELGHGWKHLAAVRAGNVLKLYVDGKQVAASSGFTAADYDVSNDQPLKIGLGDHDHFNGSLSGLRLYNGALSDAEVRALAAARA